MYLDALVVKVRENHQVRSKSAHIAVGVDLDGIKDVLIACCDGLVGLPEAIEATWPHTTVQTAARDPQDHLHHQLDRVAELPAPKDHQEPRHFPNDRAVVKLLWLAIPRHRGQTCPCPRQGTQRRPQPPQGRTHPRRGSQGPRLEHRPRHRIPRPANRSRQITGVATTYTEVLTSLQRNVLGPSGFSPASPARSTATAARPSPAGAHEGLGPR